MRARRAPALLAAGLTLGCALPAAAPRSATRSEPAKALVYYPPGACTDGVLEIEVFDRSAGRWTPHPEHPRLAPGACVPESPERLFNELRVRCADAAGRRPPSDWVVGAELASAPARCPTSADPPATR